MAGAEFADAQELNKAELLTRIESVTLEFLRAVEREDDPELYLVNKNADLLEHEVCTCNRI